MNPAPELAPQLKQLRLSGIMDSLDARKCKVLGRKGLMPNPKAGTVAAMNDLPRVIEDSRKGRVEYKLDRTAIIHVPLGKVSFDEKSLLDNLTAVVEAVVKAKPTGSKGQYVKSAFITSTMGPGVKLDLNQTLSLSAS